MPVAWHYRQDAGELTGKVNNGVGRVCQTAESLARELAPAVIRTGLSLLPLLLLSPLAAPVAAVGLVAFSFFTVHENRRRAALRKARTEHYNRDFGLFAESVQHVKPIVHFGQTGRVLDGYQALQDNIRRDGLAECEIGNTYSWRRNLALSVAKRTCQGIWIWQYRQGTLDGPTVMYLNMVTEELLNSFWSYSSLLDRIYECFEPTRLLVNLLHEQPAIRNGACLPAAAPAAVGISIQNVTFSYGTKEQRIMRNFDLEVESGRILGIVGPSGGGKSTIHSLLARMYDVSEGAVCVGGRDIREWPLETLRGLFSYVSSSDGVFLSGATLLDTIRFARPDATDDEVKEAASLACIYDDIERMPDGWLTVAGQRGVTLSKGQQQRIALAQALIALTDDRRVLVLDEFTSALDSCTEERILANIEPLLRGRTVIIIAHRLSTVRNIADRIVVIDRGAIVEDGTHDELVQGSGYYARTARLQAVA